MPKFISKLVSRWNDVNSAGIISSFYFFCVVIIHIFTLLDKLSPESSKSVVFQLPGGRELVNKAKAEVFTLLLAFFVSDLLYVAALFV